MGYEATVKKYLREAQKEYNAAASDGQHTAELSFRTQLHAFFVGLAHDLNPSTEISVILEPKNQGRVGRPDWRIHDKSTLGIFGYIEAKGPSDNPFDIDPYQKQINKYLSLGHNLVITDGIDFVFCLKGTTAPVVVSLIEKSKMSLRDWSQAPINPRFEVLMRDFFDNPSPQRCNEEKLVELVAVRTRNLADDIMDADMPYDQAICDSERRIIDLFSGIKTLVYEHNDPALRNEKVFADFLAQVIMFSLLYAHRVLCSESDSPADKEQKIKDYINKNLTLDEVLAPFRNLMVYLRDNADSSLFICQWIDECVKFLSFVQMTDEQLQNPDYHRLFELFLAKYDTKARFDYGAFYTPKSLADFVVKIANYAVAQSFPGQSIYDDGNTIIDPCCGTGSFLEQIIRNDPGDGNYTLCGFEILPTPYMLANYRMAVVDKQLGHKQHRNEIILANTLSNGVFGEEVDDTTILGHELKRASVLSSMPLKVIIGNPPSSDVMRENETDEFSIINELIDDFRPPVEGRHGRQNTQKQVKNPFMQFIRWGCKKLLDSQSHSVLAFIVPLSFLDSESYQYGRKFLCENFSNAWVVAIDADSRSGMRSDSIFNTLQGRAVVVLTHQYGVDNTITKYHFCDYSQKRKSEKEAFFLSPIDIIVDNFEEHVLDTSRYKFLPVEPIDEVLYGKFWPVSDAGTSSLFLNQCSGIKLGATSLLTNVKEGMLRRRTRELATAPASELIDVAKSWTRGSGQKTAQEEKIVDFQDELKRKGNPRDIDKFVAQNIASYSFRPFVTTKVLLWRELLQKWRSVGGGGTRYRNEIMTAYGDANTIGFSVAHAPKDINTDLGQFVSFCWYYPDNDLCSRGNGHIYLNQYPDAESGLMVNNINTVVLNHVKMMTGKSDGDSAKAIVFYTYAIMCSQVYMEKFKGVLYTPNQSDARARVPIVTDKEVFEKLVMLGQKMAQLEKDGHQVDNILNYDYPALEAALPTDFKLDGKAPFDEETEELILKDDTTEIRIRCPLYLQQLSVAGYPTIKNWLKFNGYASTHCTMVKEDMDSLLDFLNTIAMHVKYTTEVDSIVVDIMDEKISVLEP